MKRDLKTLNRTLAITIAAAMAMTSAPSAVFAADPFSDGTDAAVVAEAPAAEEPELVSDGASEPVEEVFTDEAVTEEVNVDVADAEATYPQGTAGTPAKVGGVWIDTNGKIVSRPMLRWEAVPGAYKYEVVVTDAAGNEYTYSPDSTYDQATATWKYVVDYYEPYTDSEMPYAALSNLGYLKVYKITEDGKNYEPVYTDAEKKNQLGLWTAGQTYTIKVRAVNKYQASAAETAVETPGEWSDGVPYTVTAAQTPIQINNLRYSSEDDDYLYFDFDGDITAGDVIYQTSEDQAFTNMEGYWGYNWADETYKLRLDKDNFVKGKTYYLRAANSVNGEVLEDAEGNPIWSAPTSFMIAEEPLKTITGFARYNTTQSSYEFHFDPVLESGDNWEIQYSKDPNFATDVLTTGELTIYKSSLDPDVDYFVRAITYKYDANGAKVYGTPSTTVTIRRTKTPSISNLSVAERTQDAYVLKYDGTLNNGCSIEYWVSENSSFTNNPAITNTYNINDENSFSIYLGSLKPGKTYYVRARAYSGEDALYDPNTAEDGYYSSFTNTVTIKPTVPKADVSSAAASTSIVLSMFPSESGYTTGYQIYRKVGKRYQLLKKTTEGAYTDKGLKPDTTYTYRVRAYYLDEDTNKTSYGPWTYYDTTTWGGNLNLKASAKSKSAVKLSWNRITGAQGYEVYRSVTFSNETSYSGDTGSNGYVKWTLVRDLKSKKARYYTIKGLTAGADYSFKVRAYKTVGSKKYYISDSVGCSLGFELSNIRTKKNSNGTVKISWSPVYAGNGYLVEKYDEAADEWITYKTIKKSSAYSVTLPKAVDEAVKYRIRAYKNGTPKQYTDAYTYTVQPYLAAPTGVTAKANKADGSIRVSWKAVPGADSYEVYRTTSPALSYNKDTKSYSYGDREMVSVYVPEATSRTGYKISYEPLTATSIVDKPITYTNLDGIEKTVYKGPRAGVKYYYYVVAVKNGKTYENADNENTYSSGGSKAAYATVSNTTVSRPSLRSVKSTSKIRAALTWKRVSGASGYEIYRSTRKTKGYTKIATITKGSTYKYTDKTAVKGKKYYYKIRAVKANEAGVNVYSSYSNIKYVKVKK